MRRIRSFPLRGVEEKIKNHLEIVKESVELLKDLIDSFRVSDWTEVCIVSERIASIERGADEVKRSIEMKLYKGILFVGFKEDFLRLMEATDVIADKAKEAGRVLSAREVSALEVESFFKSCGKIEGLVEGTVDIVMELQRSVSLLDKDSKEALNSAHTVEKAEEKLDEIKLELLMQLAGNERSFSTLTYLQFRDFILTIDMIADAAEEASDVLVAMILKASS